MGCHSIFQHSQNIATHYLSSESTAAKEKQTCLRYCTIYTQHTYTDSTTGFELVNVCWWEVSHPSLKHSIQKLIAFTSKNPTRRWVEYLFESIMIIPVQELIQGGLCINRLRTNDRVLILCCYHNGMTSI